MFLYRCASCGSDRVQLRSVNEGFSYGKAVAGALVFGTAGAVAGLAGKKTTKYYCPQCGQTLDYPMNATQALDIDTALIHRNDPSYTNILRIKKKIYPGIDWQDPDSISDNTNASVQIVKERPAINPNASTEALLQRIEDFIEDSDWDNANYYCEYLLDKEPSNAEVYQKKLLIENQASDIYELGFKLDESHSHLDGPSYNKYLKYGGDDAEKWCEEVTSIARGYLQRRLEASRKHKYDNLIKKISYNTSTDELTKIKTELQQLGAFEEAEKYIKQCDELIERKDAEEKQKALEAKRKEIAEAFKELPNAPTVELAEKHLSKIKSLGTQEEIDKAEEIFQTIKTTINARNKKNKKNMTVGLGIIAVMAVVALLVYKFVYIPWGIQNKYNQAIQLEESQNYAEAKKIFQEIKDYKDSKARIKDLDIAITYEEGMNYLSGARGAKYRQYMKAKKAFDSVIDYKDAAEQYKRAEELEYEAIKNISFDDGNQYNLADLYSEIMDFSNDSLKEDLLKIPQINAIIMLEGTWYFVGSSGNKLSSSVTVHDGYYEDHAILYISGKYYRSYNSSNLDSFWEIYNISSDKHDSYCHVAGSDDRSHLVR